ncbi:Xaa-Pro dipeptidase [Reinekea blandensis]|uniref:Xaa-Pro dipeptidase n=1 Tax=Reinekea blandensis MED297 TaxID=314283 RepID=A4BFJ1_9GAMM|nr:Xaa-Pro dipeptidase [Reinekea blandensis]EAR09086.1 Xaa-Pro aminopeptidase [Reinekea sp. MED297] [Reinekea blandensis MED297]
MSLYHRHLQTLVERFNHACEAFELDAILLYSGWPLAYPYDDMTYPFRPFPMVQQWLPYLPTPDTWVLFSVNQGLSLHWPEQQDFWHVSPSAPKGDWTRDWNIQANGDLSWLNTLKGNVAVLAPYPEQLDLPIAAQINPTDLMHWLNYDRAVKTEWEIDQMRQANDAAARGHKAAAQAFHQGLSEYEIHLAYLQASHQQQVQEPYSAIVALNERAATLHYEQKQTVASSGHRTLLIDAGAQTLGYASDITRTTTPDGTLFATLVSDMDRLQQELVAACTVDTHYQQVHELALQKTAELLHRHQLCTLSPEAQLAKRIPQTFFPHGIGHLLGLQVHDIGGFQQDRDGTMAPRPEHAPFLRLLRPLQDGMTLTIEPGLYFIPMLLEKMIAGTPDHGCDLDLIDSLKPFGGIRIEDNVLVRQEGPLNLTRAAFDNLPR